MILTLSVVGVADARPGKTVAEVLFAEAAAIVGFVAASIEAAAVVDAVTADVEAAVVDCIVKSAAGPVADSIAAIVNAVAGAVVDSIAAVFLAAAGAIAVRG